MREERAIRTCEEPDTPAFTPGCFGFRPLGFGFVSDFGFWDFGFLVQSGGEAAQLALKAMDV
jgi:hypothetical protein